MQSNPVTLNELLAAQYFALGGSMDAIGSKFVKPHLPKKEAKTAKEIFDQLAVFAKSLPVTEAGIPLLNLHIATLDFLKKIIAEHEEEAAGFAAYLSDVLGDSVAQQRFNSEAKAAEAAEEDKRNIWEVA